MRRPSVAPWRDPRHASLPSGPYAGIGLRNVPDLCSRRRATSMSAMRSSCPGRLARAYGTTTAAGASSPSGTLARESSEYRRTYGLVPTFKAGLPCGNVTTGEIGVIRKDSIFTGDVLHTTARIQGLCNDHGVDILVSGQLAKSITRQGPKSGCCRCTSRPRLSARGVWGAPEQSFRPPLRCRPGLSRRGLIRQTSGPARSGWATASHRGGAPVRGHACGHADRTTANCQRGKPKRLADGSAKPPWAPERYRRRNGAVPPERAFARACVHRS
jgi:class 3 adenylate cyclase